MQQRGLQQVRVSVSLTFLIHGLIIATWASRIPAFQAHLHLSPAVLGRSLMMAAIGSVVAMPAAGWLINKFGHYWGDQMSRAADRSHLLGTVIEVRSRI
jgi:MFS family permease